VDHGQRQDTQQTSFTDFGLEDIFTNTLDLELPSQHNGKATQANFK
jgi:hypothetical protein